MEASAVAFASFECVLAVATNDPLVNGQQLIAPDGSDPSGKPTCSMTEAEDSDSELAGVAVLRFDDRCRALQQSCEAIMDVDAARPVAS